ncbi:hypothetical protein [Amycolatopsis sp. FDAARGOS 1241]|uniref:hypothetical protein n=1 Tax=Amycolatopsis sp. FDAARGOS 1241 TaxID=2778070 RepID=UPI0019529659|nr:hypothetical protein [Amycolatopsis sp. FDAARGOS 1241]QRP48585.1 hypothetical protein I6J71_12530 [Amycolatopsis sp. FDAARGOS 1241]
MATAGLDGSVRLLGDTVEVITAACSDYGHGRAGKIAIIADNRRVIVFDDYEWVLRVLDARGGELLWALGRLRAHCSISPTGRFALSATEHKDMVLLDLVTFEAKRIGRALSWNDGFSWPAVSDDGRSAVNTFGLTLQAWRLGESRCAFTTTVESPSPMDVAASADARIGLVLLGSRTPRVVHTTAVVRLSELGPTAPWSYARPQPTDRIAGDALVAEENLELAADLLEVGRFTDARRQLDIVRGMPAYCRHPRLRALCRRIGAVSERTAFAGVWPTRRFDDVVRGRAVVTRDLRYAFAANFGRGVRVLDLRTAAVVHSQDHHELQLEYAMSGADDRHVLTGDSECAEVLWDLKTVRRVGVVVCDDGGNPVSTVDNPTFDFVRRDAISLLRNRLTGRPVHGGRRTRTSGWWCPGTSSL